MAKLKGIDYLLSSEKGERDAVRAARLQKATGWMMEPLRKLLSCELDVSYEDTLFTQDRVVIGGREITIPKLRTIPLDKGASLSRPGMEDIAGTHDPRAKRVGLWARRLGLDELPQLELVASGDMRMVSVRPLLAKELPRYREADPDLYDAWQKLGEEAQLRAGVTGLSQYYRHYYRTIGPAERQRVMQLDVHWMTHASPVYDNLIASRAPYELVASSLFQRQAAA